MKITWKIFFSAVLVMTVTFCFAGCLMISVFFESSYEQAVSGAKDINRMFLRAFGNYLGSASKADADMTSSIKTLAKEFLEKDVGLRIVDGKGKILYENTDRRDTENISGQTGTASALVKEQEVYYIKVRSNVVAGKETYHVVTWHEVTFLFREREEQVRIYQQIMLYLLGINGIVSWILARFLVRPLGRISKNAKRIADGDLDCRIAIHGKDEIGEMALNFNRMADSLSGKILELKDASRRQEEFIGSFAHELKTPLTSIIGYADLLRSDRQTEEERFVCANYIFKEGKRLETLSLRLLDLIVVEQSKLKAKPVCLSVLFEEVEQLMRPVFLKEGIHMEMTSSDCKVMLEPELIETVIINLLDNARKAVVNEGHISLQGWTSGEYCYIEVADNGRGIPKEEVRHITEAFYMVDKSRSREQGGAGLGLAISQKIVSLHGGEILFESEEGKGTKVRVRIPLLQNEGSAEMEGSLLAKK